VELIYILASLPFIKKTRNNLFSRYIGKIRSDQSSSAEGRKDLLPIATADLIADFAPVPETMLLGFAELSPTSLAFDMINSLLLEGQIPWDHPCILSKIG
jgi:hypothetical protein